MKLFAVCIVAGVVVLLAGKIPQAASLFGLAAIALHHVRTRA